MNSIWNFKIPKSLCACERERKGDRKTESILCPTSMDSTASLLLGKKSLGSPFVMSYYNLLDVAPEGLAYLI